MKTLRLLNIAAFLLLFTPFFQMCSDSPKAEASTPSDSTAIQPVADSTLVAADSAQPQVVEEKPSALEKFWELITVPGDNFTATAFGLFVITAFDVFGGSLTDIWIGSIFTIISLFLTIITLILFFKNKTNGVLMILGINLGLIVAAFIAAFITFDSISQVKWGYYLYLIVTLILFMHARSTLARPDLSFNQAPQ